MSHGIDEKNPNAPMPPVHDELIIRHAQEDICTITMHNSPM